MAWLAVNEDGSEYIHEYCPHREWEEAWLNLNSNLVEIPKGSIEKLTGKTLTWEDEPVEIK